MVLDFLAFLGAIIALGAINQPSKPSSPLLEGVTSFILVFLGALCLATVPNGLHPVSISLVFGQGTLLSYYGQYLRLNRKATPAPLLWWLAFALADSLIIPNM